MTMRALVQSVNLKKTAIVKRCLNQARVDFETIASKPDYSTLYCIFSFPAVLRHSHYSSFVTGRKWLALGIEGCFFALTSNLVGETIVQLVDQLWSVTH